MFDGALTKSSLPKKGSMRGCQTWRRCTGPEAPPNPHPPSQGRGGRTNWTCGLTHRPTKAPDSPTHPATLLVRLGRGPHSALACSPCWAWAHASLCVLKALSGRCLSQSLCRGRGCRSWQGGGGALSLGPKSMGPRMTTWMCCTSGCADSLSTPLTGGGGNPSVLDANYPPN